jgi:hypothetical protein
MDEHDDLIERLRRFGRRPVGDEVSAGHLAAIEASPGGARIRTGRQRLRIIAAFTVGLVAGTSGLATAGALPDGAQEVAHRTLGAVGINVPHGDRYWGQECAGEAKKNHGQYVRSQPKDKRAEAAASRCGKPVQAGAGGDDSSGGGTVAGCQGPPPWAGKGKPDAAAKAARKQACGQGQDDDGDDDKGTPAPAAGVQPAAPVTPETSSTTAPPASAPETSVTTPTTATTGPAETTVTTGSTEGPATTTSTARSEGSPTPSTPVDPPAIGPS